MQLNTVTFFYHEKSITVAVSFPEKTKKSIFGLKTPQLS